jgi:hypothetical protein
MSLDEPCQGFSPGSQFFGSFVAVASERRDPELW